ncbi:MAG: hypothetical protein AVO33_01260 [delta proteobacterium ML8_F1]|nr:MAG: hypothetical protein AVO33_01260 [delta proteobacterium ML8_F1]
MEILINDTRERVEATDKTVETIKKAVEAVLRIEELQGEGEVSISLVKDEEILELNRTYRNQPSVTDVLSFPQYDHPREIAEAGEYLVLGDIVIAVDRMKEQARELGHSQEREATYLSVHGMYHLLGYDHTTPEEQRLMRGREKAALEILQVFKG